MSNEGTLGSMLQGVSQQPPAVRPEGKVKEQINLNSDVVQGLTSRPALIQNALIEGEQHGDYSWSEVEIAGEKYIIAIRPGSIRMWDLQGNPQTITEQDAQALAYIGYDMRTYVYEDALFIANRDVNVEAVATADTSSQFANTALVQCLGGLFSRTYRVRIRYADNTTTGVSYTTPDGTASGDADETTSEYIIKEMGENFGTGSEGFAELFDAFNLKASTVIEYRGNVLSIYDPTTTFTMTVDDGEDGTYLRGFIDKVDDITFLPETGKHGHVVRVTNSDEGDEDDYYMRFNSDISEIPGEGFGESGVWEEWFNPQEVSQIDLETMPHVIEQTGPAAFSLSRGNWQSRRVGDEETNPMPDFIGYPIRDMAGFQSRLCFVAGPYFVASKTNEPLDFFKKTVLAELDTDPVSISSTQEGTVRMDWIIPFDRDLVLMSDPGTGQFIIDGSSKMTSENASLVKSTAFEMRGGAKPVETGRTILFPFKSGRYSGLKEFFTNDDVATNGADTITESTDRYIEGLVDHMQCSTNFNMAVFKTDAVGFESTVWVYKYLWQNIEKIQSSLSKWVFPHTVEHFFFSASELFVVMSLDSATSGYTDFVFTSLDLDIPVDDVAEYHVCLDRQITSAVDSNSEVVLPYASAAFVQGTGCATPGRPVEAISISGVGGTNNYTYGFDTETVPSGAEVICGLRYQRELEPTMPYARGRDGRPLPRTHLVVNGFMIEYEDTGYLKAEMTSKYRQDPVEFEINWFPTDDDPEDPTGRGLRSGIVHVPWGERNDWSQLKLTSDDVRPTTILEIEWTGEIFTGSRE